MRIFNSCIALIAALVTSTHAHDIVLREQGKAILGVSYPADWKQVIGQNHVIATSEDGTAWSVISTLDDINDPQAGIQKIKKGLEEYLKEIEAMPEPEQTQAREALARDYPELAKSLRSDVNFGEEMAMTPTPQGGVAGPASNPFAVYVAANPLEHAAAGAQKYMGFKERKAGREYLDALSAMKQKSISDMLRSGMGSPQGQPPQGTGWMDEDEWERRYGRNRRA